MRDNRWAPLDPSRDPARWEAMIGAVLAAAEAPLGRRRRPERAPVVVLADWLRPALAAAAVVAAVALGALARGVDRDPAGVPAVATAEALGLPSAVSAWVEAGRTPSVEELVVAMEGGR